jgi:hypothetical protein
MRRPLAALSVATAVVLLPAHAALAATPTTYKNCTELNKHFAHGIGKAKAVDHVASGSRPVTTFRRDDAGFAKAMSYNKGLDRDKDSIACEKR